MNIQGPLVTIVIVNWNGQEFIKNCLDSIQQITYEFFNVIVVDNASTDDSCAMVERRFPTVTLIRNKENLGFAGGNNIGIRYALQDNADYVLLLNNDTVVSKDFLNSLINVAESDERIGILGSKVLLMDQPNVICFAGGKRRWTSEWAHIGLGDKDNSIYNDTKETDYIYGCAMMVRRSVLEDVGMFDERYFVYVEEIDLNLRAKKAGYKLVYVPQSVVWHKVAGSDVHGRVSPFRQYYMTRNNLLLLKIHGTALDKFLFAVFVFPKWALKSVISLRNGPQMFVAFTRGLIDFFRGRFGRVDFQ